MMETALSALYFFVPAYVANTTACIFGHGRPVDLGRNFLDGRRLLGDGVTIRGLAAGTAWGVLAGLLMTMVKIPFGMDSGRWMAVSFLLAFGALVGDAA
ncbi:MAG: CDP-archaeol synthase, partial [Euryarchaeota archaeon]|nr:CDP-archaeol synthase [Euryarchaeota archaeon]